MRDSNVELTYADVARRVDAIAEQFAELGVKRGDVVAAMLPNRVVLLGLMAAWRLGAAATDQSGVHAGVLPEPDVEPDDLALSPYHVGLPRMYVCSAAMPPGLGAHGMRGANAAAALHHLDRVSA
jgi:hypothetical protein